MSRLCTPTAPRMQQWAANWMCACMFHSVIIRCTRMRLVCEFTVQPDGIYGAACWVGWMACRYLMPATGVGRALRYSRDAEDGRFLSRWLPDEMVLSQYLHASSVRLGYALRSYQAADLSSRRSVLTVHNCRFWSRNRSPSISSACHPAATTHLGGPENSTSFGAPDRDRCGIPNWQKNSLKYGCGWRM
jgi:hypothetical protein